MADEIKPTAYALKPEETDPKVYAEIWHEHYRMRTQNAREQLHQITDPALDYLTTPSELQRRWETATFNDQLASYMDTAYSQGWTVAVMSAARDLFTGSQSSNELTNVERKVHSEAAREFLKVHQHFTAPLAKRVLERM